MRSVPLVVRGKLRTTSPEAKVKGVMIGLTIGKTIRSVIEIVRDLMVELGRSLGDRDLVVSLLLGGLVMRSLWSMRSAEILGALGATGDLGEVEALQREDPLPVVVLQSRGVLRQQGILAKARHPLNGDQSTPNAKVP